tara:strand:- start:493 stop:804 length:312 start_codon:yes stop_codon:yes gene_type:complete
MAIAKIAAENGTCYTVNVSECEVRNANQKTTAKSVERLAQVVATENLSTWFQIGTDDEMTALGDPQWGNGNVFLAPLTKSEIFVLKAGDKIRANRKCAVIIYN